MYVRKENASLKEKLAKLEEDMKAGPTLDLAPPDRPEGERPAVPSQDFDADAILRLARIPLSDELSPVSGLSSMSTNIVSSESSTCSSVSDRTKRVALKLQLETQRAQLRNERERRYQIEDQNRVLIGKLSKADLICKRLSLDIEELTENNGSDKRGNKSVNALWREKAKRLRGKSPSDKWVETTSMFANVHTAVAGFFSSVNELGNDTVEEEKCALRWESNPLSRNIVLSSDGRTASFDGVRKGGYAFVSTAEPPSIESGYGFEVQIARIRDGANDGMAIGFTSTAPEEWPDPLPEGADLLPGNLAFAGYDGQFCSAVCKCEPEWVECPFNTRDLEVDDVVGVQVSHSGTLKVTKNGQVVYTKSNVHLTGPVYGIVDLIGATDSVRLVNDYQRDASGTK